MKIISKLFLSAAIATTTLVLHSLAAPQNSQVKAETINNPIGVVELFTSQGCHSCPPADKTLAKLIEEGEVIALSYHITYWDYIGWKDTLGSEQSTQRQYDYAKAFMRRGVYTPQAVLNGRNHINGGDYRGIKANLADYRDAQKGLIIPLSISEVDKELVINIGDDLEKAIGQNKANIMAVYFDGENEIDIKRGENRGKTITYHHSVRDIQTIGTWDGKATELRLPTSMIDKVKKGGCAIFVQSVNDDGTPGPILGAASYQS